MGETVAPTQPQDERQQDKARFVCRGVTVPFLLLAVCFAGWGSAANLTDVMVGVFRQRPRIRNAEAPGFESLWGAGQGRDACAGFAGGLLVPVRAAGA